MDKIYIVCNCEFIIVIMKCMCFEEIGYVVIVILLHFPRHYI